MFKVLISVALDRVSRDQGEVATLYSTCASRRCLPTLFINAPFSQR